MNFHSRQVNLEIRFARCRCKEEDTLAGEEQRRVKEEEELFALRELCDLKVEDTDWSLGT